MSDQGKPEDQEGQTEAQKIAALKAEIQAELDAKTQKKLESLDTVKEENKRLAEELAELKAATSGTDVDKLKSELERKEKVLKSLQEKNASLSKVADEASKYEDIIKAQVDQITKGLGEDMKSLVDDMKDLPLMKQHSLLLKFAGVTTKGAVDTSSKGKAKSQSEDTAKERPRQGDQTDPILARAAKMQTGQEPADLNALITMMNKQKT